MSDLETTCWTLVDQAAQGDQRHREFFAERYYHVVSRYLNARWSKSRLASQIEDACQEVFIECFRVGGPLERVDRTRAGGFRAYLYGIARNVARRFEQRQIKAAGQDVPDLEWVEADETALSQVFDRAWAQTIMKEAGERQASHAEESGPAAVRRVELLRLRFRDEMPIRDIASQWQMEAEQVHREYAKARKEFLRALKEVVVEQNDAVSKREVQERCRELIEMLS